MAKDDPLRFVIVKEIDEKSAKAPSFEQVYTKLAGNLETLVKHARDLEMLGSRSVDVLMFQPDIYAEMSMSEQYEAWLQARDIEDVSMLVFLGGLVDRDIRTGNQSGSFRMLVEEARATACVIAELTTTQSFFGSVQEAFGREMHQFRQTVDGGFETFVNIYPFLFKETNGAAFESLVERIRQTHNDEDIRRMFGWTETLEHAQAHDDPGVSTVESEAFTDDRHGQIVLLVSGKGGEQKSTVSVALAKMLGSSVNMKRVTRGLHGDDLFKVALISFDFKHESLRHKCGITADIPGITELEQPEIGWSERNILSLMYWHPEMMVWVMPGPLEARHTKRFEVKRLMMLLDVLQKHFDMVLVDMPIDLFDNRLSASIVSRADSVVYLTKLEAPSFQQMSNWIYEAAEVVDPASDKPLIGKGQIGVVAVSHVRDMRDRDQVLAEFERARRGVAAIGALPNIAPSEMKWLENSRKVHHILDISRDQVHNTGEYRSYFQSMWRIAGMLLENRNPALLQERTPDIFYPEKRYAIVDPGVYHGLV